MALLMQALRGQTDAFLFIAGYAFFFLGVFTRFFPEESSDDVPWCGLSWFGILSGLFCWQQMLIFAWGDSLFWYSIRTVFFLLASLCLFEFGRAILHRHRSSLYSRWLAAPLLALLAFLSGSDPGAFNHLGSWLVVLPATITACAGMFQLSGTVAQGRTVLRILGLLLLGLGISFVTLQQHPTIYRFTADDIYLTSLRTLPAFWRALLGVMLTLTTGFFFLRHYSPRHHPAGKERFRWGRSILVGFVFICLAGYYLPLKIGQRASQDHHRALLHQTRTASVAINPMMLKQIIGKPDDMPTDDYQSLRHQLIGLVEANPQIRWAYTMRLASAGIVFTVDSTPLESGNFAAPGTPYPDPPPELFGVFQRPEAVTVGPYTDSYGTFVSGFCPIVHPLSREIIGVIGLDVNAGHWIASLAWQRLFALTGTLFFGVFLLIFFLYQRRVQTFTQLLQNSEKTYRRMFEDCPAIMLMIDPESYQILDVNPAGCQFYGLSRRELLEKKLTDFDVSPNTEGNAETGRVGENRHLIMNLRHRNASGDVRDLELRCSVFSSSDTPCLLCIVQDVTSWKTLRGLDAPLAKPVSSMRILIVEDNHINQKVALKLVERLGHEGYLVGNGIEALKALNESKFDFILMDIQMPEMDGFDTTRAIRSSEKGTFNPLIPIVAMTAHIMKEDRDKCIEVGMNDYLAKPVSLEDLRRVLQRWTTPLSS